MRRFLKLGLLTGTELTRLQGSTRPWRPLYDTPMFTESVAHLGDPAVAAHRRRVWRWAPVALPLMLWLLLFAGLLVASPPPAPDVLPVSILLGAFPLAVLMAWTAYFVRSFLAIAHREPARREPAARLLSPPIPDFDALSDRPREALPTQPADPERIRAELEVIARLRSASRDPDRISALDREERALLDRMMQR